MKKIAFAFALSGILIGTSMAGSIDNASVYTKVSQKNVRVIQNGSETKNTIGTDVEGTVYRSTVTTEVYGENIDIRQNGYKSENVIGTKIRY